MTLPVHREHEITDEGMADLMLRSVVSNAIMFQAKDVPLTRSLQRGVNMLRKDIGELVGSQMRHVAVAHIMQEPLPEEATRQCDRDHLSKIKPNMSLEEELAYAEAHLDRTSFTSMATLADLYKKAGYHIEAHCLYGDAMSLARKEGLAVHQ